VSFSHIGSSCSRDCLNCLSYICSTDWTHRVSITTNLAKRVSSILRSSDSSRNTSDELTSILLTSDDLTSILLNTIDNSSGTSSNICTRLGKFGFRIVNNLGLNRKILNSLSDVLLRNILNNGLLDGVRNILYLIFNSIIVLDDSLNWDSLSSNDFLVLSDHSLNGNLLDSLNLFINNLSLLVRDILNSAFSGDLLNNSLVVNRSIRNNSS
jgi:hypothetical protein